MLSATAKFSLQSSARNQFFGKVLSQHIVDSRCIVAVNIQDLSHPLHVSITLRSAERLKLITEKEVMVMFKAPWVKVSATTLEEKNNLCTQLNEIKWWEIAIGKIINKIVHKISKK